MVARSLAWDPGPDRVRDLPNLSWRQGPARHVLPHSPVKGTSGVDSVDVGPGSALPSPWTQTYWTQT